MAQLLIGMSLLLQTAIASELGDMDNGPTPDTIHVADTNGVDSWDLQGAVNTTGLPAAEYISRVGELKTPGAPIKGAVEAEGGYPPPFGSATNARVACIEARESGGGNVWRGNTPPVTGDKPGGVLQYFESTFQRGAHEMGHYDWSRWIPWQARAVAAHDLALGRRSQWTVSGC